MPVSARPLLVLALLVASCDRFDAAPPSATSTADAGAVDPEETRKLAQAAADAALACARTCVIHAPPFDDASDGCTADAATVAPLAEAARSLLAHTEKHVVPGEAAAFAKTASLFAEWMTQAQKLQRTRGTLRLYQDVADAWNAYQPKAPIPVDPIVEYRLYGFGSKGYIMKPTPKTEGRVVWKSCYDGPCLWENHW
ncbi:Hypothetical protein A7982_07202 [Minicystis rosea]|nr:Hypothetical protein A7982_07202 [Minicystis rosea]